MFKYSEFGKHLRLGNYLFLWSGLQSILKDSGNSLELPEYYLWSYLENPPQITNDTYSQETFHFRTTNYSQEEKEYLKNYFTKNKDKVININLGAHLQSELWFKEDIEYIKEKLRIKQEHIDIVRNKYSHFFTKPTIGIGIRRGDFVGHSCFYQIPEDWYEKALEANFPDYQENYNIVIFSDDIEWCKRYYAGKNFLFAEPNSTHLHDNNFQYYHNVPMEQFILGSQMNNFIGGSSTFSWWQMWYVKNFNGGEVVHSNKNLDNHCLKEFYNPDYYPQDWVIHEV